MTKVLKLEVDYDGYYGGDVHEMMLLPLDVNGVLFEELEEGFHDDSIYLGEIEGKHSEVHGDLDIRLVDLEALSLKEVSDLIVKSNFDEFESYFEEIEGDFIYADEYSEDKIKALLKSYGVDFERIYYTTERVHDKFIQNMKDKYVENFKNITVREADYKDAIYTLGQESIQTY